MVHTIELSYLREEAAHCSLVLLPVRGGRSPAVPPLDHGSWLELECPQFIGVGAHSGLWLIPEAEIEEHLVSPGQQPLAGLLVELQAVLAVSESVHAAQEGWAAT